MKLYLISSAIFVAILCIQLHCIEGADGDSGGVVTDGGVSTEADTVGVADPRVADPAEKKN